jgi:phenylpropionate dioxygenase-like ring-hydroxylating dioxygenase large terminal subunit
MTDIDESGVDQRQGEPSSQRLPEVGPGLTWQDLLDTDSHPVPAFLREQRPYRNGTADISKDRYLDRRWHELEKERLWRRVWQLACREEHVPEVGDYVVYDIADQSYVIVRTAPDRIAAYPNACLHRGRRLKSYDGRCSEIRCPFHGFAWHLDGTLKGIPAEWDFPQLDDRRDELTLPAVQVGTWAGFVFINPDPGAPPLDEFLGELPSHFERWHLEDRFVQAHVAKVVRCNWKIAMEAFAEGYHVSATHPQGLLYVMDPGSQIDVYGSFARQISPSGSPSPLLQWEPTEEEILRAMLDVRDGEPLPIALATGQTARAAMADAGRARWRPVLGDAVEDFCDAELVDHFNYTVFPNIHPWGGFNRIVYRFRPNGDDHESCIFEVMFVAPFTGERPKPAPLRSLSADDRWTDAPELDSLGMVLDQDTFNMEQVHLGLKVLRRDGVVVSRYQEAIVRWRQDLLDEWLRVDS